MRSVAILAAGWIFFAFSAVGAPLESGPLAGIDADSESSAALRMANEDCLEIEACRIPKHAEPYPMVIRDGGSRLFIGDGYVMLMRRSLFPVVKMGDNKIPGYSYGYELFLGSLKLVEEHPDYRPIASKVWFVPYDQMDRIVEANRSALQARMPPLEKYMRLVPVEEAEKSRNPTSRPSEPG